MGVGTLTAELESPQVRLDGSSNSVAIWIESDSDGIAVVQAATMPFNGSWSSPVTVSQTGKSAMSPQLVVNSSGLAVAAWLVKNSTYGVRCLCSATLPFGGSWSSVTAISSTEEHVQDFSLQIDDSGNNVLVWSSSSVNNGSQSIMSSTLLSGGAWSAPVSISTIMP